MRSKLKEGYSRKEAYIGKGNGHAVFVGQWGDWIGESSGIRGSVGHGGLTVLTPRVEIVF